MSGNELTDQQRTVLNLLVAGSSEGFPPTLEAIGERMGGITKNTVRFHMLALQRKGLVEQAQQRRMYVPTDEGKAAANG